MNLPSFVSRCPSCSAQTQLELGQTGQVVDCPCGESFRAVRGQRVTRLPIASICMVIWAIGSVAIGINWWNNKLGALNQIQDLFQDAQEQLQHNLKDLQQF